MKAAIASIALAVLCSCASVKPALRQADEHVRLACEALAFALAERAATDANEVIAKTCALERFTRTAREILLSQQIEEAEAAGLWMPPINSGALEQPAPLLPAE